MNMNMLDYLDWRGDITFEERPFNEVDNLIFSTLAYVEMENLVSYDDKKAPTIKELSQAYQESGYDQSHMVIVPKHLLLKAAASQRFRNVRVKWYINKIDVQEQLQFSAVTFSFAKNQTYIAFRGTDNTLVGWREDCNLSYLPSTPGQREAVEYLNRAAKLTDDTLIVGGHSKGGNLAVYASAFCDFAIQGRIIQIYSNDGPGFNNAVLNSPEYLSVLFKTTHIITDSSIVGLLLSSKAKKEIIKSSASGFEQHNPYTWNVKGTAFEKAEDLSQASVFMNDTIEKWISELTDENKKLLINSVFDSLESSGATTLNDITNKKWEVYNAVVRAIYQMNFQTKNEIGNSIRKLFEAGRDVLMNQSHKGLTPPK